MLMEMMLTGLVRIVKPLSGSKKMTIVPVLLPPDPPMPTTLLTVRYIKILMEIMLTGYALPAKILTLKILMKQYVGLLLSVLLKLLPGPKTVELGPIPQPNTNVQNAKAITS